MSYDSIGLPFKYRSLSDESVVAVSESGDHIFLSRRELDLLTESPDQLPLNLRSDLKARFFLKSKFSPGTDWLLKSRKAAGRETVAGGPSLHIIVPTLQCEHSCQYCQVSRALDDDTHVMSKDNLQLACRTIFQSESQNLTVEFQGGDPLLRFDLVLSAMQQISDINKSENRNIRFVVASTLHQLTPDMCHILKAFGAYLSTSIDGQALLHQRNRPIPTGNAYERTMAGVTLARSIMGEDSVAALMTTTKASLEFPEQIVDEYVRLGFGEIFIRPLSSYGFAKRNQKRLGYSLSEFMEFYQRSFERVLYWNDQGVPIREVYGAILLNKILSPFDSGYVDLQSPTGAGLATLVYNYDGFVYPSDEARMLAESGDHGLRLGPIGEPLDQLLGTSVQKDLIQASLVEETAGCLDCAYSAYCAPNPVDAYAQHGDLYAFPPQTEHCQRHTMLFDFYMEKIKDADMKTRKVFHEWAFSGGDT
ncbi:MAG: His-Xaa-Ser system radical SAM maturase HxsB [Alcanivorax sp.]|uniref:His-Xaa-Ser system radical SAM maturase HxsB n=1 Tax=Alloalcanivorax marinus TaxID=1177169 RepID=UPI00195716B9|nr:His-Xaa-Ser system radical SAM maturase HxsB [Alloalcanivorax marinus]